MNYQLAFLIEWFKEKEREGEREGGIRREISEEDDWITCIKEKPWAVNETT